MRMWGKGSEGFCFLRVLGRSQSSLAVCLFASGLLGPHRVGTDLSDLGFFFFFFISTVAPVRMQVPMRSLPMMKAYDPEADHKPIVPKAVSLSCSLGEGTIFHFPAFTPKQRLIFWLFSSSRRSRPSSVWRNTWRTFCRYATQARPACAHMVDVAACRLTCARVFSRRTSRCRRSTAPSSPTWLPWRDKWMRPPGRCSQAHLPPPNLLKWTAFKLICRLFLNCAEIWVVDAVLADLPDGPGETSNHPRYTRWPWHSIQADFRDSGASLNLFLGLFHHVFHIFTQLLWWPNARRRQPPWSPCWALASPSVTSRASTSPCSASTPPAIAGAWTAAARRSRARKSGDAPSVQKVKHGNNDLLHTAGTDRKDNQHSLVHVSSLFSLHDASAPEGDGCLGCYRWEQVIQTGSLHGEIDIN